VTSALPSNKICTGGVQGDTRVAFLKDPNKPFWPRHLAAYGESLRGEHRHTFLLADLLCCGNRVWWGVNGEVSEKSRQLTHLTGGSPERPSSFTGRLGAAPLIVSLLFSVADRVGK
jgi:hypothetical protein